MLGFAGTLLFFFGLRFVFSLILRTGKRDRRLHIFNVRQLQENVIRQSLREVGDACPRLYIPAGIYRRAKSGTERGRYIRYS